jgi:hypothetical protein
MPASPHPVPDRSLSARPASENLSSLRGNLAVLLTLQVWMFDFPEPAIALPS